jgi:phenylalanyl-tRNA synthetase beta chain
MRFTLSWLKEHLETEASLEEITSKLTSLGLVVDKVENKAEALAPFTICEIIEAEKHPNADRLKVCRVNTGSEVLQIVCGAPNARPGLKTVLAHPGDVIPATKQALKVGKVRDVESFGMMCSADELLLGEGAGDIIELDSNAPVGNSYATWAGLDDILIDIEVSPNRGDCLGVYGIARDLAATGIGVLNPLPEHKVKGTFPSSIQVTIQDQACLHFTGRLIKDVKNGPSPAWLQKKLQAIGLKPISALVDITNYFTYDQGRPLHVFDADKLKGHLKVRSSKAGEVFQALDGKTYDLPEDLTIIADESGVIALGGIMGGDSTACDDTTQNVFLESAFFDPIAIAMAGRSLGILSDSRYRFERGVDPASTLPGLEAATQMILDLCGGEASEIVNVGQAPDMRQHISFNADRIESLGGMVVPQKRTIEILQSLGFEVKETAKLLSVTTPSWRFGMEHDADLVEEILRVEGYDTIPAVPYGERPEQNPLDASQRRRFMARDVLAGRGLMEVVTWSFLSQKDAEPFGGVPDNLVLLNPITQDLDRMRPSLLPHLLNAVRSNQNRGSETIALFEIGPQYTDPTPQGQQMMASGVRAGLFKEGDWVDKKRPVDLFDAKGDTLALMEIAVLSPQLEANAPSWYHPGRSGTLKLGPLVVGYFGEIHPRLLKAFDLKGPVVAFEVFLNTMPLPKRKTTAKPLLTLSPFQAVDRDFAFVVDQKIPAETLIRTAKKVDPSLIEGCTLFDVFELPEGKKSLGLRVRLQPKDHTLAEEEIQTLSDKIISSIAQATGGVLRQ